MMMETPNLNESDAERLIQYILPDLQQGHRERFDSLSLHEKEYVLAILREIADEGTSPLLHTLWEIDFVRQPVPPHIFISDPYYFADCEALYDQWKADICYVLDPVNNIDEHILTGGIGTGKTSVACLEQLYELYYLSCMRSPQKFYGTMENSVMVVAMFNITLDLEHTRGHKILGNMIKSSGYFLENFPPAKGKEWGTFPNNIAVIAGSGSLHALGANIFSGMLDEINFQHRAAVTERGAAFDLFSSVKTRMENRYTRQGINPGLLSLVSSRKSTIDFIEKHIEECHGDKRVHISDYAVWDVKPPETYKKEKFFIFVGDEYRSSRVLVKDEPMPTDGRVISVPVDFKTTAERNVDEFLRDVAGIATYSIRPLIPSKERYRDCIIKDRLHPFSLETLIINLGDHVPISDYFNQRVMLLRKVDGYQPRVNPGINRYVHVDIGITSDALGMAMVHASEARQIAMMKPDGSVALMTMPLIYVDFMIQVVSSPGNRVDLFRIIEFILYLRELNYHIETVTFDRFESEYPRQALEKVNINTGLISVDKTDKPYTTLMRLIMNGLVNLYDYPILTTEILNLQHFPRRNNTMMKVDHPQGGSKDVADALAGATYSCYIDPESMAKSPFYSPARGITTGIDRNNLPQNVVDSTWVAGGYEGLHKGTILQEVELLNKHMQHNPHMPRR